MSRVKILFFVAVAAMLFSVSTAKAGSVITDWNYDVSVKFTGWSVGNNSYSTDNIAGSSQVQMESNGTVLKWGQRNREYIIFGDYVWSNNNQSSLTATGSTGSISTDGNSALALTLKHTNAPLSNVTSPTSMDLSIAITLTAAGQEEGIDVNFAIPVLQMTLNFLETTNDSNNQSTASDDVFFVFDPLALSQKFVYDGIEYDFTLSSSFVELDEDHAAIARRALGYDDDVILYGWYTKEGIASDNIMSLEFQVRHETIPVDPPITTPEPATLLVLGAAGLLGLPVARRFRKRA